MKLLYLSCHSILEYDELKIFEELGIDYFSLGSYINPRHPQDPIRPPLNTQPNQELLSIAPPRDNIPASFFSHFDTIMVMHVPEWIEDNWDKIADKTVIWRTIGQSTPAMEAKMAQYRKKGLKIVRYSPREERLINYAGADAIIRFYKDENEFNHWQGPGNEVITIAQDMMHRAEFCNYNAFTALAEGFNSKLYGPRNENSPFNGGFLTYDQMKMRYREARVYIYTGTQPASYTLNFIEALMTGVPIVAIGPKYANSLNIGGELYEIPDIIQNGVNGFWSDDIAELRGKIQLLLENKKLAEQIGKTGRETAIALFGKEVVKSQWRAFFKI